MKRDNIKVSVLCITYNQVDYIRTCLDSLLSQRTDFEYEVIVHDDASVDGTREIIEEYERKNPGRLIAIHETANQYSKNPLFFFKKMLPYASGKYIAFCEGDDYWTDVNKLQMQYDYMERNPGCALCFHNADALFMDSGKMQKNGRRNIFGEYRTHDNRYNSGNINMSKFATGNSIPTASEFYRFKDVVNLPSCYYAAPCGDLPLEMILSHVGYAYYMPKSMSIYRRNTGSSVTDRWQEDRGGAIKRANQFIKFLEEFDVYSDGAYSADIAFLKKRYMLDILIVNKRLLKVIFDRDYKMIFKGLYGGRFWLCKLIMRTLFPNLYRGVKISLVRILRKVK